MKKLSTVMIAAALLTTGPALAKKKPELTPMELQALQSHEYETSKEILFASVVSVFQDLGYQLENADMGSGFITASSATRNRTGLLEAFSGTTASGNTRATAFVEAMPNGMARVRLNFLNSRSSSSRWGQQSRDDRPVLDPQTYRTAWDKIDQAVFTRSATTGTVRPAAPGETAPPTASAPPASAAPPAGAVAPVAPAPVAPSPATPPAR